MNLILITLISLVIFYLLLNDEKEVLVVSGEVKAYVEHNDMQYIRYIQRECGTPQPSDYLDSSKHFPQNFIEF